MADAETKRTRTEWAAALMPEPDLAAGVAAVLAMPRKKRRSATVRHVRADDDPVTITLEFEHLLRCLLGRRMSSRCGHRAVRFVQPEFLRVVDALDSAIEANVIAIDPVHATELRRDIEIMHDNVAAARNAAMLQAHMIHGLTRLAFDLLGGVPDHWDRKRVTRNDWELDRTVSYGRTLGQRIEQFRREVVRQAGSAPDRHAVMAELHLHHAQPPRSQLAWLRMRFPAAYAAIHGESEALASTVAVALPEELASDS